MARCASDSCRRWAPEFLIRRGAGASVDERWFCSESCVETSTRQRLLNARPVAAGIPAVPPMRIGSLLRHCGAVSGEDVSRALIDQRITNRRIGVELVATGVIDDETLLKALASQAGVRYLATVDTTCVHEAPGGLSPDTVRALDLVPFREPVNGTLKVACTAPVPRLAVTVLRQLTGLAIEPYLVTDAAMAALVAAYGQHRADDDARPVVEFVKATGLADAASRIAARSSRGRHMTVTEAVCLPHVWVRMKSDGLISDMLVDYGTDEEGAPCLAANTSH